MSRLLHSPYTYVGKAKVDELIREKWPNATVLGEFSLPNKDGGQTPTTGIVMWNDDPKFEHPYFTLFNQPTAGGMRWVVAALPRFDPKWPAVAVKYGPGDSYDVVISRFNHDYVGHPFVGMAIDGGRECVRFIGNAEYHSVEVNVHSGKFRLNNKTHTIKTRCTITEEGLTPDE